MIQCFCDSGESFLRIVGHTQHLLGDMAKGGGGGGSQLAQLKARMHSDGITDRRQMKSAAKKRKRGQAASERDEQLARREKLAKIASSAQFNPFEEKVTKPKAIVLGQKVRGATGKPGAARQGGQRERMERLLPEWQNRNKSGSFVDRRFGEGDSGSMSVDDKMLERFTRERQRKASKSELFNLNDAEEVGLTHYGRSLNDLDTYDDIHLSDEESECPVCCSLRLDDFVHLCMTNVKPEYSQVRSLP